MIKQILENSSAIATEDDLNGIKERLETIDAREKELERTIRRLEHASQRDENQVCRLIPCLLGIISKMRPAFEADKKGTFDFSL